MKNQSIHLAPPGHNPLPPIAIPVKTAPEAPQPGGFTQAELRRLVLDLIG